MNDALLFEAIAGALRLTVGLEEPFEISQNFQTSVHGRPDGPALLIQKIGDKRIGSMKREDFPDLLEPDGVRHVETQAYESTFQVNALAAPPDANGVPPVTTASDWANLAAAAIQSDGAIAHLLARDIGILRVTTVRNPKFMNDQGRFEAEPSFDFVVTHTQIMISKAPSATIDDLAVFGI